MKYTEVFGHVLASSIRLRPDLRGSSGANAIRLALGLDISKQPKAYYKFSPDFARELAKVSLNKIMGESLPDGFCATFQFLGHYIFVRVIKNAELTLTPNGKLGLGNIAAFVIKDAKEYLVFPDSHWYLIPFGGDFVGTSEENFADCQANLPENENTEGLHNAFRWVLNSLAYIHSGKPDLRTYTAPKKGDPLSRKERDRITNDMGQEDATLVSWGWKKPALKHTNNWEVVGHFWWMPYGPGRTLRKLDWREGHVRGRTNASVTETV